MKKKILICAGLLTAIAVLSINLNIAPIPPSSEISLKNLAIISLAEAESYCKHQASGDTFVCRPGSQGQGSVCVVENCGGWFQPDCDCYETGWE
jgi:hypothetical protein